MDATFMENWKSSVLLTKSHFQSADKSLVDKLTELNRRCSNELNWNVKRAILFLMLKLRNAQVLLKNVAKNKFNYEYMYGHFDMHFLNTLSNEESSWLWTVTSESKLEQLSASIDSETDLDKDRLNSIVNDEIKPFFKDFFHVLCTVYSFEKAESYLYDVQFISF